MVYLWPFPYFGFLWHLKHVSREPGTRLFKAKEFGHCYQAPLILLDYERFVIQDSLCTSPIVT